MNTPSRIDTAKLIEMASEKIGSQNKLAAYLGMNSPTLSQMKQGKRPCNWRTRSRLLSVIGMDPTYAYMTAMADELEKSENDVEKDIAKNIKAIINAFPEADKWRKR